MDSRTFQFKATPSSLPMAISQQVMLGPHETKTVSWYEERESAVLAAESAQEMKEQVLVRRLLDSRLAFPILLPQIGVSYPDCLVILESLTNSLINGWTSSPGELDLLAVPTVEGRPQWSMVASVEVKKVLLGADGSLSSGETGTRQILGAARTGVDTATLVHLILPEPSFSFGSKATILASGPDLRSRMRIKHKRQIQALAPERVGYAAVGLGHLPSVPFRELSSADWEVIPPVPIGWRGDPELESRRTEMVVNLSRFFFSAAHESDLDIRSVRPLYMFRSPISGRWILSKFASFQRRTVIRG